MARERGEPPVTENDVRQASELIEQGRVRDELESLPTQSHITLYAVWALAEDGSTPAKRSAIYDRYTEAAQEIGADVKTDRTIHDRLSQLNLKGLLDVEERNEGLRGGSYYQYELDVQSDMVRQVLAVEFRTSDLFD